MDQNIIRVCVGEIIDCSHESRWLICNMNKYGDYKFINITNGNYSSVCCSWESFKSTYYPIIKRINGSVKGIDLLGGEDWLCHRCYPSILAGGCFDCMYSGLIKERKRYFEPGDVVWIPSEKKKRKIIETALFISNYNNGPYFKVNDYYDTIGKRGYYSIRYKVGKYPQTEEYYRWDQIRLVKRNRHFINPKQLKDVCNDLCLFGPYGGVRCSDCETGKIWKEL